MASLPASSPPRTWPLILAATAMLMVTMGIRQSLGLFVRPIDIDTGLGIAAISVRKYSLRGCSKIASVSFCSTSLP